MKTKFIVLLTIFAVAFSCKKDDPIKDPIFEFASFKGDTQVTVNEFDASETAVPVVIQLWAFKPYTEDITFTYEVTGNNTEEGVDFIVEPASSITLKAGKLTSDTIWVKTIDNGAGATSERTFDIKIVSASKSDIKIGLGIADPKQKTVTFTIADDECSLTTSIYTANLSVLIGIDGDTRGTNAAVGVVSGNHVSITGDLIWYGAMDNPLVLTFDPGTGATKGAVTFGTQELGTAQDGYEYRFIQFGTGTFDVCSGTITITYDTEYRAVGETDWTPWQRVTNLYHLP